VAAPLTVADAAVAIVGDLTQVRKDVKGFGGELEKTLGDRMKAAFSPQNISRAVTAGGAAAGALFTGAIGGAANFEDQLRTINTVAKLTDEQLKATGQEVLNLSKETGKSTDDLTAGLYDLISAGIPAGDAIKVLKDSAILATGAIGTTAEGVDLLTSTMGAWGLEARQSTRVMDVWAQAVADGKTTVADLASGISQVAPIAAGAGIALEEVAAATTIMTLKGDTASQAMTRIKNAISALLTPNAELNKIQKETGINFAELAKEKGLLVALEELRKATNGNQESFAKALGSSEALTLAFATTGENAAAAATELAKITTASQEGGVAQAQYEERMKSAVSQGKKMVAGIRATALEIGGPFVDSLGAGVIALNELGGGMGGLVNLSRLFGGTIGAIAGKGLTKLGGLLKRGIVKAILGSLIPATIAGETVGAASSGGIGSGMKKALPKAIAKAGLAKAILGAIGTIAVPVVIALVLADLGEKQIEQDAKPKVREMTARILADGTREGLEQGIQQMRSLAHNAGRANPVYGEWIESQIPALELALQKVNGQVTAGMSRVPADAADSLRNGQALVTAAGQAMVGGLGGALLGAVVGATSAGRRVVSGFYRGITEKQSVVQAALADLITLQETTMDKATEIAYLTGVLTSTELAAGLHDKRDDVRMQAEATRAAAEERLRQLHIKSGNIGKETNENLAKGMKDKDPYVRAQAERTQGIVNTELRRPVSVATTSGENIAKGLAAGMRRKAYLVEDAAKDLAFVVSNYVKILSPAKMGPLSEGGGPEGWGSNLGGGIAAGLLDMLGVAERAASTFAGSLVPQIAGGPIGSMAMYAPGGIGSGMVRDVIGEPAGGGAGGPSKVTNIDVKVDGLVRARDPFELANQLRRFQDFGDVPDDRGALE